jgi:hypothetical protein
MCSKPFWIGQMAHRGHFVKPTVGYCQSDAKEQKTAACQDKSAVAIGVDHGILVNHQLPCRQPLRPTRQGFSIPHAQKTRNILAILDG